MVGLYRFSCGTV